MNQKKNKNFYSISKDNFQKRRLILMSLGSLILLLTMRFFAYISKYDSNVFTILGEVFINVLFVGLILLNWIVYFKKSPAFEIKENQIDIFNHRFEVVKTIIFSEIRFAELVKPSKILDGGDIKIPNLRLTLTDGTYFTAISTIANYLNLVLTAQRLWKLEIAEEFYETLLFRGNSYQGYDFSGNTPYYNQQTMKALYEAGLINGLPREPYLNSVYKKLALGTNIPFRDNTLPIDLEVLKKSNELEVDYSNPPAFFKPQGPSLWDILFK